MHDINNFVHKNVSLLKTKPRRTNLNRIIADADASPHEHMKDNSISIACIATFTCFKNFFW